MQIAHAGAAQGCMERPSQGKASAPGAGSGHGLGGAGWLGRRLFRVNNKQICSKAGSKQRSGRSDPCSDPSGLRLLVGEQAWPGAAASHMALANSPSRNVAKWISSSLSPARDLAENKESSPDSSKPPGIPAMPILYRVPEKKGEEKKTRKKKLPGCSRAAGGAR